MYNNYNTSWISYLLFLQMTDHIRTVETGEAHNVTLLPTLSCILLFLNLSSSHHTNCVNCCIHKLHGIFSWCILSHSQSVTYYWLNSLFLNSTFQCEVYQLSKQKEVEEPLVQIAPHHTGSTARSSKPKMCWIVQSLLYLIYQLLYLMHKFDAIKRNESYVGTNQISVF